MAQDAASSSVESLPSRSRCWRFASAVFDERTLELSIGGEPIDIERKPSEVLLYLLLHAGEVVTKDELLEAVWPRRILTETALTKCIARLREALGDTDQTIIKTLYGMGYRLIAPVRVEASSAPPLPRFDFAPGDTPPSRPHWKLSRRLGGGSHGEAWLAQHDKTAEQRVFKFALDASALVSLKREITLFRLLNDTLEERARAVRLLDWNLEQPPCFIETEFIAGGSLADWIAAQNGFGTIPLMLRIDIAAQIADALAGAHSVGVLHKDLKPSNVFADADETGRPRVKLGDFGSGGIIDPDRLDALHITRLGFTGTLHAGEVTGTLTYLAPEVLAGQPSTVQTDIYALGVILYQLTVGDLQRPLAPGWERDVDDELLREDIAAAADIDPARRLGDAGELARRLRTLDARRQQRADERRARDEMQAAQKEAERLRARRTGMRIALGVLIAALIVGGVLFVDAQRARNRAESERARAQAVSDFLNNDVLTVVSSGDQPVKDLTVKQLLDAASQQVEKRFTDQPLIAAEIDLSLGKSYFSLVANREAVERFERGLQRLRQGGIESDPLELNLVSNVLIVRNPLGGLDSVVPSAEAALSSGERALGPLHPAVLDLRSHLAAAHWALGQWSAALREYRELLREREQATPGDVKHIGTTHFNVGWVLIELADYPNGEAELRKAIAILEPLGDSEMDVADSHLRIGGAYIDLGRYDAAENEMNAALQIFRRWENDDEGEIQGLYADRARAALYQGKLEAAEKGYEAVIATVTAWQTGEKDQTAPMREGLALVYQQQHHLKQAQDSMSDALTRSDAVYGGAHPQTRRIRLELADIERDNAQLDQAERVLSEPSPLNFDDLPQDHPLRAALSRVRGLIARDRARLGEARTLLQASADSFSRVLGPDHWQTRRANRELAEIAKR